MTKDYRAALTIVNSILDPVAQKSELLKIYNEIIADESIALDRNQTAVVDKVIISGSARSDDLIHQDREGILFPELRYSKF